jgi:hypothetical protein
MGWKAFVILASAEPGYFGSQPSHDAQRADALRDKLGLSAYERTGESDFISALYPRSGALWIGAYPRGTIVCHMKLPSYFFDAPARRTISGAAIKLPDFKAQLLDLYPKGQVLAIVLHSVVNLWGYSLYANGQLVRSVAGASDDGIFANVGEPLPEESRVLDMCSIENVDEEGYGEDLVFDVATRFLGGRIDELESHTLAMSQYEKRSGFSSLVKRLFARA